jgi:alcohol dehydrogenase (cytochrome c)/quinohemoprotein ethanol dehydrogenase
MSLVSWATGIDPKTGRVSIHPDALYSATKGVTVHPVQMHNTSQMSFNPNTGLIYVPISADSTFQFIAADTFTPTPGRQNYGMGSTRGANVTLANPPTHGPERKNPDGSALGRGQTGILTAWNPATQKEAWFTIGGGQTGGGTLSTASNLVIQTLNNGHLKAFTADKGEQLLDMALPLTSGVGAPMTFMLDGKQYIAVLAGTGAQGGRGRGGPPPAANQEITAAAAQRGNAPAAPALPPAGAAPTAPAGNNNPKMFVYAVSN